MEDLEYALDTPIEFAKDGETDSTKTITLKACSYKQRKESLRVRAHMFQAFMELSKLGEEKKGSHKTVDDEDVVVTKEDVCMAFSLYPGDKMDEAADEFEKILLKSAFLQEGILIKRVHIEAWPLEMFLNVMYSYIAHFIGPSFATTMKGSG